MNTTAATSLLREVSRSFYLTLRVLPVAVRQPIGLAYLLARTTDTIADTELLPVEARLEALSHWRERIMGRGAGNLAFETLAKSQASESERILLQRGEEIIQMLADAIPSDRERIRSVLETITSGQELDLRRFNGANGQHIISLQTGDELEDYTYRVAGCVGEFWTGMCLDHLFTMEPSSAKTLVENGIRFGKGLQLVNILRDLPQDLRNGRCYIPSPRLREFSLTPTDMLSAGKMPVFRPLYDSYLDKAQHHLTAGWAYTNSLPRGQWRLRLACAWPILIGAATLRQLRVENTLDARHRIKISRAEVRRLMVKSVVLYPWRRQWERQLESCVK